jgi:hypothetical protein
MRAPSTALLALATALASAGCATIIGLDDFRVDPSLDAGTGSDASPDAATLDAASDAATPADSGAGDAATSPDAATPADASSDAGPPDSGVDAAAPLDAGPATDAGDAGLFPRVVFLEPFANGIANVAADNLALLSIETPGFTLRSPNDCRGEPNCGHAHVTIDGTNCNNVGAGKAYNIQITAPGPTKMNMAFCQAGPTGIKTIAVELVQENHAPFATREIATLSTNFIRGKVRLTAPLDEDVVTLPSSNLTPLRFMVSDFTLRAPGQCGALTNCGHARVTIDGTACNAPGQPYNVLASATSGVNLNLAHCSNPLGTKNVRIDLVDDTGAALNPVQSHTASVTFVR